MEQNSLIAFERIKPELPQRQLQVYLAIEDMGFATNAMIAKYLHLPINCVTGRCLELRKYNLVVLSHQSWCPVTKGKANYWTTSVHKGNLGGEK